MLLMRLGILESLSEEQINAVREHLDVRRLIPQETLFTQGECCEHLHVIQDGALQLLSVVNGFPHISEIILSGHVLGEIGMVLGIPYPCTAQVAQGSLIASLHRDDLRRLIEGLPSFGWQLLRLLSRRLMGMQVRLQALSSSNIRVRVGAVLLQLVQETNSRQDGSARLSVRQAEIGQMAGASRESVSRLLTEWSREELVAVGRGQLLIPDVSRLQASVEEACGHSIPTGSNASVSKPMQ